MNCSRTRMNLVNRQWLVWSLTTVLIGASGAYGAGLDDLPINNELVVVLGEDGAEQALQLARRTDALVYVQLPADEAVRLRAEAAESGIGGDRLYVGQGGPERLHLGDQLADWVVATGDVARPDKAEITRVLRPGGTARLGANQWTKPVPEGVDDWSHPYHGPDNNPLSNDRLIRAPYLTQFLANPRYGPAPQAAVAAGGRVFKAYGHVAWHEREEPFLNMLVAYNGDNGRILWQQKLPSGMMVHRNTLIATDDIVYVGDDQSCKLLDAATGERLGEIKPPLDIAGGTFWKWMALKNGVLYALIGDQELKDPEVRWKRQAHGWPWNAISRGYNQKQQPWGFGRTLLAMDPETGRVLWHHREEQPADGRAVCMNERRLFAFAYGKYLLCLDRRTGEVLWRKDPHKDPQLFEAIGPYLERQGWQTNWRTAVYLKCNEDALYFAGPQLSKLLVVSAKNGEVLWQYPYDNFQLVLYPDAVYAISGPWGTNVSRKFDPLTGEVLAELPTGRRACTRPTATMDSLLFRAMGGTIRFDLKSERPRWISPMRPPCQDGVTVAGGHLYWWPYACDCQLTLYGVTCLTAAGDFDFHPRPDQRGRLESFASGDVAPLPVTPADWPTFRAGNEARATNAAEIPAKVSRLCLVQAGSTAAARLTPPVTVDRWALVADSEGAVSAWRLDTRQLVWRVHTGAEIRLPPTIWEGRAIFGSGDGWIYAVEATTGRLLWRYRAAPAERLIPVYGRLLSTWPVASGVLVDKGVVYAAAGLVNYDGTYVYALDAATGRVRWCNDTSGHLDVEARCGVSVQGHMLLNGDRLYLAGGNAVSPAVYDTTSGKCLNDPSPLARCESTSPRGWELFLVGDRVIACGRPYYADPATPVYDHTVTKKLLHTSSGSRDIVWIDNHRILCFDPIAKEALNRCVTDERIPRHITQAWGTFRVEQEPLWQAAIPDGRAIAVGRNAVVVADRKTLRALDLAHGRLLWDFPLPAEPVPWGMAVNRHGTVVVTLTNGQMLAVGQTD